MKIYLRHRAGEPYPDALERTVPVEVEPDTEFSQILESVRGEALAVWDPLLKNNAKFSETGTFKEDKIYTILSSDIPGTIRILDSGNIEI